MSGRLRKSVIKANSSHAGSDLKTGNIDLQIFTECLTRTEQIKSMKFINRVTTYNYQAFLQSFENLKF